MIDPLNPPTLPKAFRYELEEFLLFAIAVAGHHAESTAIGVDRFLRKLPLFKHVRPFRQLMFFQDEQEARGSKCVYLELASLVKSSGIGCYNMRARSFIDIANTDLDLKTCKVQDLEEIYGIGMKTSRFFILYTRPWVNNLAILDVHVLRWMAKKGYKVPRYTPKSKQYLQLEQSFLDEALLKGITPAELDKEIWTHATRNRG